MSNNFSAASNSLGGRARVGSGYDITARAVARHIGSHIPGKPTVIVQNQPGAGSLAMTNALYNTAARDGTVIGAANNGMPTAALLSPRAARYDPNKLTWIGSQNRDSLVLYVWHTVRVQHLEDLFKTQVIVGATAPGTGHHDMPLLANKLLGLKFKVVGGYEGTAQIHKAMESGELDGTDTAWASLKAVNADWIAEKKVRILAQWSLPAHPDLRDYPSVPSLSKTDAQRQAFRLMTSRLDVGRPFFGPPEIPPARAAALRRAFEATMKDSAFLADAAKLGLETNPMTGEEVAQSVADVLATAADVVENVKDTLEGR